MYAVKAEKNESSQNLVKRFIKKIKKSELMDILRENRYFEKPSDKKRKKKQDRARVLKNLRAEREQND